MYHIKHTNFNRLGLRFGAVRAIMGLTSCIILVLLATNRGVRVLAVHILGKFLEDGSSRSRVGRSEGLGGRSSSAAGPKPTIPGPPTVETEGAEACPVVSDMSRGLEGKQRRNG